MIFLACTSGCASACVHDVLHRQPVSCCCAAPCTSCAQVARNHVYFVWVGVVPVILMTYIAHLVRFMGTSNLNERIAGILAQQHAFLSQAVETTADNKRDICTALKAFPPRLCLPALTAVANAPHRSAHYPAACSRCASMARPH